MSQKKLDKAIAQLEEEIRVRKIAIQTLRELNIFSVTPKAETPARRKPGRPPKIKAVEEKLA